MSATVSDSPRICRLALREISGQLREGGQPVGAHSDRWSRGHRPHGGTVLGSRCATAEVSGGIAVLVHGRERKDGKRPW